MNRQIRNLTWAAIIAALYVVLTLILAPIGYGMIQFRLSEALTLLPLYTPAAIPGLVLGCFLSNLLNPQNLGPVDIIGGTLATGLAAFLTNRLGRRYRAAKRQGTHAQYVRLVAIAPSVVINALIVGTYLPFLLVQTVTPTVVMLSIGSILLSQSVAVYAVGLPLAIGLEKTPLLAFMEDER